MLEFIFYKTFELIASSFYITISVWLLAICFFLYNLLVAWPRMDAEEEVYIKQCNRLEKIIEEGYKNEKIDW